MMKLPVAFAVFVLSAGVPLAERASTQTPDVAHLVHVVYVTRHGVRSPTGKADQYARFSSAAWPVWPVAPGYLTPHGYGLLKIYGAYDRDVLEREGLLGGKGCADAPQVSFRADSDQRTRESAKALSEGMFPGCTVPIVALEEGVNDPLFHRSADQITSFESTRAVAAIAGRVGDDPNSVAAAYHAPLTMLDDLLAQCGTPVSSHARTSLLSVAASISRGPHDHAVEMRGPLNTASTLTENLLLEYTEGMPVRDVGWGCVDGAKLRTLIDLHTAASDLAQRTPAVADAQSAELLAAIDSSVEQAITGKEVAGAVGKLSDKALFLIGHDTNLSNLAGALQLDWLADGRRDDTPPGSALIFEVWKTDGADYSIRTYFTTQTLEQMRNSSVLSAATPAVRVPVFLPGCSRPDMSCSASSFHTLLEQVGKPNPLAQ
jgi:4-phytase/acid phosphatase